MEKKENKLKGSDNDTEEIERKKEDNDLNNILLEDSKKK